MAIDHTTVKEILEAAQRAVSEANVPEALQTPAFEKAVDLLAAGAGAGTPAVQPPQAPPPAPDESPPATAEAKTLDAIAARLGISLATVNEVFHIEGDAPTLSIATSTLPTQKANATKEIALLVVAARQAGGWDAEWTEQREIRQVCDAYGRLDSGNFAATLAEMENVFSFSGRGRSRKVKLKRRGFEDAAALVTRLAGEE